MGGKSRLWKHKLCDFQFWQHMCQNGRTWDTGIWKKKLVILSNGRVRIKAVIERAKHILHHRYGNDINQKLPIVQSFEDDLHNHINQALVVISTGVAVSFFDNPHVRTMCTDLNPRHKTVYCLKMVRLIRCVVDVMQQEVSKFCIFYIMKCIIY